MSGFIESCEKYFGSKNLYEVLKVGKDATSKRIKKAYYKLSMNVHPDRVPTEDKAVATTKFQVLGKVYSILSDKEKRHIYDQTGFIDEEDSLNDEEDWYTFWRILFKLSEEDIKCFEKSYRESGEELKDLKAAYIDHEGDMDIILENVMCCSLDDEDRFTQTLQELIENEELPEFEAFSKESKKKKAARKRKNEKEKREAEEMRKELYKDAPIKDDSENALASLIQKRQENRMDSLLAGLEAKYCQPKTKKSKKLGAKSSKGKK